MVESVKLMGAAWALALAVGLISNVMHAENLGTAAVLGLFVLVGLTGLFRFLYAFLFMREIAEPSQIPSQIPIVRPLPVAPGMPDEAKRHALPSQQTIPASLFQQTLNTKEIAPSPSVSEHTTRLLDDQGS
jgi:hypothetical protein